MFKSASQIAVGETVTYCGETFVAATVTPMPEIGLIRVGVLGKPPQYIAPEREVEIVKAAPEKPFAVYTRDYDAEGNCDKRIFRFATRKAQESFMGRTNRCVTFYTT